MIYYVQTNLDKTICNVSKKYKQGYITIDVPNFWMDRFLNNFNDFWVDSNNVLHKPGTLKPSSTEISTKTLKEELEEANNEIENIKSSVADNSDAFFNALNSKVDKEAINSVRDTLIAVNSQLASLPNTATKQDLIDFKNETQKNYNPLVSSLSNLKSELNSKADISTLSAYVTKEKHQDDYSCLSSGVKNGLSSLDYKKADSLSVANTFNNFSNSLSNLKEAINKQDLVTTENFNSTVKEINNNVDSKANKTDLNNVLSVADRKIDKKSFNDQLDSKADKLDVNLLATSTNVQLNTKANITYVDNKYYKLLNHIGDLSNDYAVKSLTSNFSNATSSIGMQLDRKADLEYIENKNKDVVDSINNILESKASINDLSSKVDIQEFYLTKEKLSDNISDLNKNKVDNQTVEGIRENLQNQINTFNEVDSGVVRNVGAIQEQVNGKANKNDLEKLSYGVDNKVDVAQLDNLLITKADKATFEETANSLANNISSKANKNDLNNVRDSVVDINSGISSVNSSVESLSNGLTNATDKLNGKIYDLTSEVSSKATREELDSLNTSNGSIAVSLASSVNNDIQSLVASGSSAIYYVSNEANNVLKLKTDSLDGSLNNLSSLKADKSELNNYAKASVQEKNSNAIEWLAGRSDQQDKNIGNNHNLIQANALFAKGIGEVTNSLASKADTDTSNIINNAKNIDTLFSTTSSLTNKANTDAENIINNASQINSVDNKYSESINQLNNTLNNKVNYSVVDSLDSKVKDFTSKANENTSKSNIVIGSYAQLVGSFSQLVDAVKDNNSAIKNGLQSSALRITNIENKESNDISSLNNSVSSNSSSINTVSNKLEKLISDKIGSTSFYRGIYSGDVLYLKNYPSGKYWLTGANQNSPVGDNVWGEAFVTQLNNYDTLIVCYINYRLYYNATSNGSWSGWIKVVTGQEIDELTSKIDNKANKSDLENLNNRLESLSNKPNYLIGEVNPQDDVLQLEGPGVYHSRWGYQDSLKNFPGGNGSCMIFVDTIGIGTGDGKKITIVNSWGFEYENIWAFNHWTGWRMPAYYNQIEQLQTQVNSLNDKVNSLASK